MATQAQIKARIKEEMSANPRVSIINSFSNTKLRDILLDLANLVGGADELNALSDVTLTNPSQLQVMYYDSVTSQWVNGYITPRIREFVVVSGGNLTLPADEGEDGDMYVTANLSSTDATLVLPDTSGFDYNYVVRINNRSTSNGNLLVRAYPGYDNAGQSPEYVVTSGIGYEDITIPPGDYVIFESTNGGNYEQLVKVSAASGADNLGNHTATQDLNLNSNDLINVGNIQNAEGTSVALTGGALVPLSMSNPFGTYYGTHASPATSGDIEVSAAGVVSGYAEILYQAGSAPTITGITDQDVASSWDAVNINVIKVYQHADGTYVAMHLGTR